MERAELEASILREEVGEEVGVGGFIVDLIPVLFNRFGIYFNIYTEISI